MNTELKYAIWGFVFGTIGLFVLAMLSLMLTLFEYLSAPLMWPGRQLAEMFVGEEGSSGEVLLLTLFNGFLYALIFYVAGLAIVHRPAAQKGLNAGPSSSTNTPS